MNMNENIPSLISEEQEKIKKNMEVAQNTEGFSRLTEKQKSIIKLSLYLQARAERGRNEWKSGDDRKYMNSEYYVDNRNCHSTICCLEKEDINALSKDAFNDSDFFEAKYNKVETINELKTKIEEFDFPCVLQIGISSSNDPYGKYHSSLALGHDGNNNIILWEKESSELKFPYQIITLDQIYNIYGNVYYGLRKLRHFDVKD